jgi:hypothetical protein
VLTTSSTNFFLAKFDPAGNPLWAKCASPNSSASALSVSSDRAGNVCIAGNFSSPTLVIDSDTLNGIPPEAFVAKYDASGNLLWTKSVGGTQAEEGLGVYLDQSGNCFLTGHFRSPTIALGTITLTNSNSNGTKSDLFLAKYDANGNVLWAISNGGSTNHEFSQCVAVDANGNCFLTGVFMSPSITFGSTVLTNTGIYGDVFLAKYDPNGNVLWAKEAGSSGGDMSSDVSIDVFGNSFITGDFHGPTMNFGSVALIANGSAEDLFLAKYDASGNLIWAQSAGGSQSDYASSVSTDSYGNSFITGSFNSAAIVFGSTTLNNANASGGTPDIFLVKYDPSGNALWAKSSGGNSYDGGSSVTIDASNVCYLTGSFVSPSITFGSSILTNANNTSTVEDGFLARLEDITSIAPFPNENNYISIFPNPSNAVFTIDPGVTEGTIYVSDVFGKIIFQSDIASAGSTIDLSGQANGVYFIQINTGIQLTTQKLILQK